MTVSPMTADYLKNVERIYRTERAASEKLREQRNAAVRQAVREGWTHAQIAEATGLTRGRVGQIAAMSSEPPEDDYDHLERIMPAEWGTSEPARRQIRIWVDVPTDITNAELDDLARTIRWFDLGRRTDQSPIRRG